MTAWELRIKPPYLFLILAWPALLGELQSVHSVSFWIACALLLFTSVLGISSLWLFLKASTTHHPHQPEKSSTLVTQGCFRWTRNPMYLGLLLMLVALYILFASAWGLITVPLFVMWLNRFQIQVEERFLLERFGQTYLDYCTRVPRWI